MAEDDIRLQVLGLAETELLRRMEDPEEMAKIPPHVLVRAVELMSRLKPPTPPAAVPEVLELEKADTFLELVRSLGIPDERKVVMLIARFGVSAEEAANLLLDARGEVEAESEAPETV